MRALSSSKYIILHGLPGCGKSTFTADYVKNHPNEKVVVVNRDDIRTQLFGAEYHNSNPVPAKEKQVTQVQDELIRRAAQAGYTIVDDNTNLNPKGLRSKLNQLKNLKVTDIHQQHFDVSVEEAKRRNKARGAAGGRFVPPFVIDNMAKNSYGEDGRLKNFVFDKFASQVYMVPQSTPGSRAIEEFNQKAQQQNPIEGKAVVIVDIDGTLAHNAKDADIAFGRGGAKDYHHFFSSVQHSPVNESVKDLANSMRDQDGLNIVVVTGRSDEYGPELVSFLERSGLKVSRVIARPADDHRKDFEFKQDVLNRFKEEGLIPVHAIDDRDRSIEIFEKAGISVSKVKQHIPIHPDSSPESYEAPVVDTSYGSGRCIRCGSKLKNGGNIGERCRTKM